MRRPIRSLAVVALALPLSGCFGYRLVRPSEVEVPSYEPRPVTIPAECAALIDRAASRGMIDFQERETRMLGFCQYQHLIRAQEEEAASKKLEAHAGLANFALQATALAVGAAIAILTWAF